MFACAPRAESCPIATRADSSFESELCSSHSPLSGFSFGHDRRIWLVMSHLFVDCHHDPVKAHARRVRILFASASLCALPRNLVPGCPDHIYWHLPSLQPLIETSAVPTPSETIAGSRHLPSMRLCHGSFEA